MMISLAIAGGFQSPWENKDGQSFRVFTSRLDWHEAFRICVDNNSTLADIANPRENVFVRGKLRFITLNIFVFTFKLVPRSLKSIKKSDFLWTISKRRLK